MKRLADANMAAVNVKINPIGVGVLVLVSTGIVVYMTGLPSWASSSTKNEVNIRELLSASIDLAQVDWMTYFSMID